MDKARQGDQVPHEVARESLIAISFYEPDNVIASESQSKDPRSEKLLEATNSDAADKFRSELIAISFLESPDVEILPVILEEVKG